MTVPCPDLRRRREAALSTSKLPPPLVAAAAMGGAAAAATTRAFEAPPSAAEKPVPLGAASPLVTATAPTRAVAPPAAGLPLAVAPVPEPPDSTVACESTWARGAVAVVVAGTAVAAAGLPAIEATAAGTREAAGAAAGVASAGRGEAAALADVVAAAAGAGAAGFDAAAADAAGGEATDAGAGTGAGVGAAAAGGAMKTCLEASWGEGRDDGSQRKMAPRNARNAASVASPCSDAGEMRRAAASVLDAGSRRLPRELVMLRGRPASSKNLARRGDAASMVGGGAPISSIMQANCEGWQAQEREMRGRHRRATWLQEWQRSRNAPAPSHPPQGRRDSRCTAQQVCSRGTTCRWGGHTAAGG